MMDFKSTYTPSEVAFACENRARSGNELAMVSATAIDRLKDEAFQCEEMLKSATKYSVALKQLSRAEQEFTQQFLYLAEIGAETKKGGTANICGEMTHLIEVLVSMSEMSSMLVNALNSHFIAPLSGKIEDWKRNTTRIEKDLYRESDVLRKEIKKRNGHCIKVQKKMKKGGDPERALLPSLQSLFQKTREYDKKQKAFAVSILAEERARYTEIADAYAEIATSQLHILKEGLKAEDILVRLRHAFNPEQDNSDKEADPGLLSASAFAISTGDLILNENGSPSSTQERKPRRSSPSVSPQGTPPLQHHAPHGHPHQPSPLHASMGQDPIPVSMDPSMGAQPFRRRMSNFGEFAPRDAPPPPPSSWDRQPSNISLDNGPRTTPPISQPQLSSNPVLASNPPPSIPPPSIPPPSIPPPSIPPPSIPPPSDLPPSMPPPSDLPPSMPPPTTPPPSAPPSAPPSIPPPPPPPPPPVLPQEETPVVGTPVSPGAPPPPPPPPMPSFLISDAPRPVSLLAPPPPPPGPLVRPKSMQDLSSGGSDQSHKAKTLASELALDNGDLGALLNRQKSMLNHGTTSSNTAPPPPKPASHHDQLMAEMFDKRKTLRKPGAGASPPTHPKHPVDGDSPLSELKKTLGQRSQERLDCVSSSPVSNGPAGSPTLRHPLLNIPRQDPSLRPPSTSSTTSTGTPPLEIKHSTLRPSPSLPAPHHTHPKPSTTTSSSSSSSSPRPPPPTITVAPGAIPPPPPLPAFLLKHAS